MKLAKKNIGVLLRGVAMGAADVVPGVSGGTVAFITGIYATLLNSLKSFTPSNGLLLFKGKPFEFWKNINGEFLATLFLGIGLSFLSLSKIILIVLVKYPELLWSFFFGLIVASAVTILLKVEKWGIAPVLSFIAGAALAFWLTLAVPLQTPEALWFIFLSGALAICAMLLPGISGGFILLILGKYQFVLESIHAFKFWVILTFGAGCLSGLLGFSHLLSWILKRFPSVTIALLSGFLAGSLNKIWPWKKTVETYVDRHGEIEPLIQKNILPQTYSQLGHDPHLAGSVFLLILGIVIVAWAEWKLSKESPESMTLSK